VPMLAELLDAVVGVDTHRDTHEVEIALPTGTPLATCSISNDSGGYAELIDWIAQHTPGPRLLIAIEGTRSYGVGLARAAIAAGLVVIECAQPARGARRGKGKSDPIDAHLAVLTALRLDANRLPIPRADGDREALRILLSARDELTTVNTAQTNRLRALLLAGDDTDRQLARARLTAAVLAGLIRRRLPRDADRVQAIRQVEIRRLALALRDAAQALRANRTQLAGIVEDLAPGLTARPGIGPGQRRPGHRVLLPPRPMPRRRRICCPRRHQPPAGQQRTNRAAPAQPRRRSRAQQSHPRHRHDPDA
jgi:transposase